MTAAYSQFKAFRALTIGALRSMAKSPSSVIFTIAFPLVFILVFGFIGTGGKKDLKVAFSPETSENLALVKHLKAVENLSFFDPDLDQTEMLEKGKLDAILYITYKDNRVPAYEVRIETTADGGEKARLLEMELRIIIAEQQPELRREINAALAIENTHISSQVFKPIDFILPGQLGFSLLAASVFGTAFVFFTLRQELVLKRFFASPVRRVVILMAEGVARMLFQLLGALLILGIGRYFLGYTWINGWLTLLNLMALSAIGILVFMSFGFIISGMAKSAASIPPISNIFVLPQFLLAGTFFPIETLPSWLQPLSRLMPLTYLNTAFREVAFDGSSLWQVKGEVLVLVIWGITGYLAATRLFRWE